VEAEKRGEFETQAPAVCVAFIGCLTEDRIPSRCITQSLSLLSLSDSPYPQRPFLPKIFNGGKSENWS
jgi:hypothetical protein